MVWSGWIYVRIMLLNGVPDHGVDGSAIKVAIPLIGVSDVVRS